jgi:hypothetical protein
MIQFEGLRIFVTSLIRPKFARPGESADEEEFLSQVAH